MALTKKTSTAERPVLCTRNFDFFMFLHDVCRLGMFGLVVLLWGLHASWTPSNASGFALYTSGAAELALNDSVVAHTEGPASNFYNPALLPKLEGTQVEFGTIPLKASVEYTSDLTGRTSRMKRNVFYPSTLFISHQFNDIFSAGLGVNSTFGLGTEWPDDWEGRYIATESYLETYNINSNMAWKVSDRLILAAGFNILFGDVTYEQKIDPLLLPAGSDGHSKMKGDGEGYGYNLGLLYTFSQDLSFGMSYRSGIDLKLKGRMEWSQPGVGVLVDTHAKVDLHLPAQLFAGVSFRPFENIILEIGGKWEGWSSYKNLKIRADQPIFSGNSISTIPKNWKDVYGFNVGVKYVINPTLSIAAGYLHEENPVPSDTFEPSVPVSDRDDFSFGIQKRFGPFRVAVTYLYDKYESRRKNNSVTGFSTTGITANGKYEQDIHMVGLSVLYRF